MRISCLTNYCPASVITDVMNMKKTEKEDYFPSYAAFAKLLRTWLVGFGIGVPILFCSQDAFSDILERPSMAITIIVMFLGGVVIQVIAALLYKTTMWYLYCGERDEEFKKSMRYDFFDWVSEQYWLEVLIDLITILLFAIATSMVLFAYATSISPAS
jgi:hypothetical protein